MQHRKNLTRYSDPNDRMNQFLKFYRISNSNSERLKNMIKKFGTSSDIYISIE